MKNPGKVKIIIRQEITQDFITNTLKINPKKYIQDHLKFKK